MLTKDAVERIQHTNGPLPKINEDENPDLCHQSLVKFGENRA